MKRIKLDKQNGHDPVIEMVGTGKSAYLWIGEGEDSEHGQLCFGTITVRRARRLARAILDAYPEERRES